MTFANLRIATAPGRVFSPLPSTERLARTAPHLHGAAPKRDAHVAARRGATPGSGLAHTRRLRAAVARDDWRIRIELPDEEGARGFLERLGLAQRDAEELADELRERRLAVSQDDDTVFVYASSGMQAEQASRVVEQELEEAGLSPRRLGTEPEARAGVYSGCAARQGDSRARPLSNVAAQNRAASMQEATEIPTVVSEATDGLTAAALRAEAWAGEPFLHEGEDPARALAPETSRRRALDEALAEIEAGHREPSPHWKVRFGLMLGLERVLAQQQP